MPTFRDLLAPPDDPAFVYVEPPFDFNSQWVSRFPAEVTGFRLLESLRRRIGWTTLEGKRLLDFGCGVRFARTIFNLDLPLELYVGVDVNAQAIAWLQTNIRDARFHFAHLNAANAHFNRAGSSDAEALLRLQLPACDAACLFSVITHQCPDEALLTLRQLRRAMATGASLYFTAFLDETVRRYSEGQPQSPGAVSIYEPNELMGLVESESWRIDRIYPKVAIRGPGIPDTAALQQAAFVCTAA